jgi:hypothetical protein
MSTSTSLPLLKKVSSWPKATWANYLLRTSNNCYRITLIIIVIIKTNAVRAGLSKPPWCGHHQQVKTRTATAPLAQ